MTDEEFARSIYGGPAPRDQYQQVAAFPFAMLRGSYSALKEEHVCWFCGLVRPVLRERRRTNPIAKQNPEKPRLLQRPGLLSSRLKPSDCSYTAASPARLIPNASLQPASDC